MSYSSIVKRLRFRTYLPDGRVSKSVEIDVNLSNDNDQGVKSKTNKLKVSKDNVMVPDASDSVENVTLEPAKDLESAVNDVYDVVSNSAHSDVDSD